MVLNGLTVWNHTYNVGRLAAVSVARAASIIYASRWKLEVSPKRPLAYVELHLTRKCFWYHLKQFKPLASCPQAGHISRDVLAEDEGTTIFRNVGNFSLETASLPRTHDCSGTPLRRTKIFKFDDKYM